MNSFVSKAYFRCFSVSGNWKSPNLYNKDDLLYSFLEEPLLTSKVTEQIRSLPLTVLVFHVHSDHSQRVVLFSTPHKQHSVPHSTVPTSIPISQIFLNCRPIWGRHPHPHPFPSESFLVPRTTVLGEAPLLLPFLPQGTPLAFLLPSRKNQTKVICSFLLSFSRSGKEKKKFQEMQNTALPIKDQQIVEVINRFEHRRSFIWIAWRQRWLVPLKVNF